jgi:hypothetical protein
MLDPKNTSKAAFIQRGLLLPFKTGNVDSGESRQNALENYSHNLLKTYLLRKEKKEHQDTERFLEVPKVNCDQITLRSGPLTARTLTSRQVSSRISTYSVLKIDP